MRELTATLCLTIAVLLAVPPQTFAGVNETYICEQKKENIAVYKKRHILYWKQNLSPKNAEMNEKYRC